MAKLSLRRNRKSSSIRNLVRENHLSVDDLIYPLFLVEGNMIKEQIKSLPGNYRWSLDLLLGEIDECVSIGLHAFILFPKIDQKHKDKTATYSYSQDNYYLEAARQIKLNFPQITLISDVALDPYNIDGHDGIVRDGNIINDESVDVLCKMSLAQAQAGFDILGPSDMMDGRVEAMREALDQAGFDQTSIMSYTAKYSSAFYGPFRDALDSAPVAEIDIPKDKSSYQIDPANLREAIREAEADVLEGADFIMVKPALHYLDVIRTLKNNFDIPVVAYHVSGECAMLTAACQQGWLSFDNAMPETLMCIKRAGADIIISYFAKDYAQFARVLR